MSSCDPCNSNACDPRSKVVVNADKTIVKCGPSLQGPQGSQGLQGANPSGSQGAEGIQGLPNSTQGIQGLQGTRVSGSRGIQGLTGEANIQGIQGIQGSQGIQGVEGEQGTAGDQGSQGTQASQGTQGSDNVAGTQGLLGTQGSQGIQGIQGLANSTQGVQGTQHSTPGETGIIGEIGSQGVIGDQGTQGSDGSQGFANTSQGFMGLQGAQGAQGNQGVQPVPNDINRGIIGEEGASGIAVYDEGVLLSSNVTSLDFVGSPVSASETSTVTIVDVSMISGSTVGLYKDRYIAAGSYFPSLTVPPMSGSFSNSSRPIGFPATPYSSSDEFKLTSLYNTGDQWTAQTSVDSALIEVDLFLQTNNGKALARTLDFLEMKVEVGSKEFGSVGFGGFSPNHSQHFFASAIIENISANDTVSVYLRSGSNDPDPPDIDQTWTGHGTLKITTLNHSF